MNREQIKHAPVSSEVWRNNATQKGGLWFDPRKICPLGDHVLVVVDEATERTSLEVPEVARNKAIGSRTGEILAIGPGKWIEKRNYEESWILNPLIFKPTTLKPGDRVIIGHFSDWESWSSDYEARGRNIVLCQEADVRLYEPHDCEIFAGDSCIECGRKDSDYEPGLSVD